VIFSRTSSTARCTIRQTERIEQSGMCVPSRPTPAPACVSQNEAS
jgi:hypothetical protein